MRCILHVTFPVEKFNELAREGKCGEKMRQILGAIKPEAAYFTATEGKRSGFLVLNLKDASEIPAIAEPWMLTFNASIELLPTMTPEDLERSGIDEIGKKWK